MADIVSLAADLWDVAQDDPFLLGRLERERNSLIESVALGTTTGDIINASKNGVSYSMRVGYTLNDRISALRLAINGIKMNIRPSRTSQVRFS